MFRSCYVLENVDISNFNTLNANSLNGMFTYCNTLKTIKLGEEFSFMGRQTEVNADTAILPKPGKFYTGKWLREDESYGPYTPEELRINYNGNTMAGTWVAEIAFNPYAVYTDEGTLYFIRVKDIIENETNGEVQSLSGGTYSGTIFKIDEDSTQLNLSSPWHSVQTQIKKAIFVDEIKPLVIYCWFLGCDSLEELDLTNLNTSRVTRGSSFIRDSGKIRKITFGENFQPVGSDFFNTYGYILPYLYPDRMWVREDGNLGPYSYLELQDNYSTENMVGTWERTSYYAVLDENDTLNVIYGLKPEDGIAKSIYSDTEIQYTTFKEWPTDGYYSSTSTVTDFSRGVKKVKFIDHISPNYISNWLNDWDDMEELDLSGFDASNLRSAPNSFKEFRTQRLVLGEYNPFRSTNNTIMLKPLSIYANSTYTGKWIREDGTYGPYTPEELAENYNPELMKGTWIWEKKKYTVKYTYEDTIPESASELPEEKAYPIGEFVTVEPDATAPGYIFNGWSRTGTFEMPEADVEITGSFTARTDTQYKVEHYLEDLNADTYSLVKTENLTGTTDTESTATSKNYEGFTFDDSIDGTKTSGNIEGDGSLVLKLYYKRNSYNVSYSYTGDVPEDASALPPQQTYEYGAEINVPEEATAEGYTFSGWIKDYITMPAQDIEITGYFIEIPKSYSYKVEYFFDGELDETLEEILNAEKDEEISLTPQTPLKHGEKNYILVSDNHKIIVTVNDEENIINVYYETDVLDYEIDNTEDTTEGDGISDKYQIQITYKVENGTWDDRTTETKIEIINLKDKNGNYSEHGTGELHVPEVGNNPNEGYIKGNWKPKIPSKVSSKDNGKEFIYSYKKEKVSIIDIIEGEEKSSNPKTADVFHRYLIYYGLGIIVFMGAKKIRRKYSRKARKIQY